MSYATYAEYLRHPRFRAVCERVRGRSGGRCETTSCSCVAVDFHHIRYCRWGDFDEPENLRHLCRKCHELAHKCGSCGGWLKSDAIKLGSNLCRKCRKAVAT
jgi:hypothetical protein